MNTRKFSLIQKFFKFFIKIFFISSFFLSFTNSLAPLIGVKGEAITNFG